MATRAIHLEVVEDMTSSSFINALRRFTALRGPVVELRSDRGTNFVGAAAELKLDTLVQENSPVMQYLRKSGIRWTFNPPHGSHMGGAWERLIGIVRKVLDALLLDAKQKTLTHEVLCTFMAEVSAIVNSRPIVPVSHDPDSPLVLTPAMLLTSKHGQEHAPFDGKDMKETYQAQWKHVQVLSNLFWSRWKEEYLQSLQQRRKWDSVQDNVKPGDIVLLTKSEEHRINWPIGVVTRVFPSKSDGLVRTVEIRLTKQDGQSLYIRPVTELIPLGL
jgi:hypothetical protein